MKFVATLAFSNGALVALVKKRSLKLPHLDGKWNGIGGKMEVGESPVGAAMREFTEETGIEVKKENIVFIEHQRFLTGVRMTDTARYCIGDEIYWYATELPWGTSLPATNDVGESLGYFDVRTVTGFGVEGLPLCPNVGYLTLKAFTFLSTPYLDLPA